MLILDAIAAFIKALLDAPFIIQFPIGFLAGAATWLAIFPDPLRLNDQR
jgi:hypothetical protein